MSQEGVVMSDNGQALQGANMGLFAPPEHGWQETVESVRAVSSGTPA